MRTITAFVCDLPVDGQICGENAVTARLCAVEGTEIALCNPHDTFWKERVRNDRRLQHHCPRCVPKDLAAFVASGAARPPQTEIPATAMYRWADQAMFECGILVDVRQRVLQRLAAIEDISTVPA